MTIGKELLEDKEIDKALDQLIDQIEGHNNKASSINEAQPALKASYAELLDQFSSVRGRPLFYPYVGSGSGTGPYVELADGSRKIDLINGIGVHLFGHGHPMVIKAAMKGAMQDIVMQGHLEMNGVYLDYSQKIIDLAKKGSRLKHGWISPSGSMLRVPFYDKSNPNSIEESLKVLRGHIESNPDDISCFCFEPVLGEGGYRVAPPEFFTPLLEECKKHGIAVWADEVQTFLRTGEPFAFQTLGFGEYVDLVSVAKTGQAGFTLYTDEYNPKPGLVAGTFASSSSSLFAGLAMMEEMENNNYFGSGGKISKIHSQMVSKLQELCQGTCKGYLEDPEGLGLMVAVTPFGGDRAKVMELLKVLFENGLIAFGCGKNPFRLRFLLPAILTENDIGEACKVIEKTILQLK